MSGGPTKTGCRRGGGMDDEGALQKLSSERPGRRYPRARGPSLGALWCGAKLCTLVCAPPCRLVDVDPTIGAAAAATDAAAFVIVVRPGFVR
eukprot:6194075-Pleurochrysis_carterae.AAC.4